MADADVFIGVASADLITVDDIKRMAPQSIVFALANPDPEIDPDLAATCAAVVASGRSDYANQINNVLCFPGLFRGMFDVRARRVTQEIVHRAECLHPPRGRRNGSLTGGGGCGRSPGAATRSSPSDAGSR